MIVARDPETNSEFTPETLGLLQMSFLLGFGLLQGTMLLLGSVCGVCEDWEKKQTVIQIQQKRVVFDLGKICAPRF